MTDRRLRDAERAYRLSGSPLDARRLMAEHCRAAGHEISPTIWVSRGALRNVHTCLCGTYSKPAGEPS